MILPMRFLLTLSLALGLAAHAAAAPLLGVAAKVGNDIITTGDIDLARMPLEQSMSAEERTSVEGKKKLAEARKTILDRMIEEKLVVLAAKEGPPGFKDAADQGKAGNNPFLPAGTEIEEEMEKTFDQTRQRFGNQDAFEAALKAERISVPEFRNRLRERVRDQMTYAQMVKYKQREFQPSLRSTEEENLQFYDENKSRFAQGEQVNLRHILFPHDSEAMAKTVLASLQKAKDPKAAFVTAARKNSADEPTRDLGGRLGWIEKGQSWPELEKAAFAGAANSLAGPVKTDAGWHLLFIEGHQTGKQRSYEEVKTSVRNLVYQQKNQKRLSEWFEELQSKYYVERREENAAK